MAQTETFLVLALGSALTFVFFLLFGRVFWGMAMNASARRNAKQVPIQLLDMQADRDRLRAEHALMARKLELRVDNIKTRMAEQLAEVSRNRNRVQGLQAVIETHDESMKHNKREMTALNAQVDMLRAELEASQQTVENLSADALRRDSEMTALQDNFRKLGATLREKNTLVGNLNDELRQALAFEQTSPSIFEPFEPPTHQSRLRQRVAELTSVSADMAHDQFDLNLPLAERAADSTPMFSIRNARLSSKVEEASRLSDQMEDQLKALDSMLASVPLNSDVPPTQKRGAVSNVIKLAQRIRALQQNTND